VYIPSSQKTFTQKNNEPTSAMKKTLLLCFIHGFKGDDNTFGEFPANLKTLVAGALPKVNVQAIVYPRFETRGDLGECVARFRDWYVDVHIIITFGFGLGECLLIYVSRLLEKVIDIEVTSHTPSPTIDPSVHVILIGHSMGGIVAADAIRTFFS
jgi:pimeloyl-ACP methyl ester carboxylesterase